MDRELNERKWNDNPSDPWRRLRRDSGTSEGVELGLGFLIGIGLGLGIGVGVGMGIGMGLGIAVGASVDTASVAPALDMMLLPNLGLAFQLLPML